MAKKTCVVNRDVDGNPSVVLVKEINFNLDDKVLTFNPSDITIADVELNKEGRTSFDIKIGEDIIGHIEITNSNDGEVQVTHSALKTGIDNSQENQNDNLDKINENFVGDFAKYLKKNNLNIVENKNKGIGKQSYIKLGNYLFEKYNKKLTSDVSRTDEAEGMWNSLYKSGFATIRGEYRPDNRTSYTYEFSPQVKVKEGVNDLFETNEELGKIGTQTQYSNYLESIFPNSQVKDIVYHLTKQEFEDFKRNPDIKGFKTDTTGFHFIEAQAVEDYKKAFGKIKKFAILDFKSPITTTEYNNSDEEHISQKLEFLNEQNAKELREQGYDSGIIDRPGDIEYIAFEPEQIHVLGSKVDLNNFRDFVESDNNKANFIPSQLFNQLKEIPFVNPEQALSVYKNIYKPSMLYWQTTKDLTNLNKETREPIIFYRADNGTIYSTMSQALKNSSLGYSIGFLNNKGNFESFIETPIYTKEDIRGVIQDYMKNDYLKTIEKDLNTYEAQDSLAAEFIEDNLATTSVFTYERQGNNFIIKEPNPEKNFNQLVKELGIKEAVEVETVNKYLELKTKDLKPKNVVYSKNQLYDLIQSFMKRVGISETSIDNYKKHYTDKYGVEPDAKVFIDINNKLIATVNGEATLDELSEEVSHFIIEGWNQEEINRMLPYVKDTTYYTQFAETYREIYSKNNSDPEVVEQYVRKEILGKMLAESLQKDFTIEDKTYVERTFFQRLGDMLRQFINYLQGKVTPREISNIEFFNNQIKNLLYNEELEKNLENLNPKSNNPIMYSVPENMTRVLNKFGKDLRNNMSDELEEELAIQGAVSIFTDKLSQASALLKEIKKYAGENNVLPSNITMLTESLLDSRESLELLRTASLRTALSTKETLPKLNSIKQLADLTLNTIGELSGEMQAINDRDPLIVARELLNDIGEQSAFTRQAIEQSVENLNENGVKQVQKDTTQINKLFGHTGKMSNAFVTLMNSIIKKMHNDSVIDTNSDFNTFINKLIPFDKLLRKFYKGNNFLSTVDNNKLREAKFKYEYSIRKKINDLALVDISEEDFINNYEDFAKLEKGTVTYYAYDYWYKKGYASQDWAEKSRSDYYNQFIENVEKISNSVELEEGRNYFYNYLKNTSDRRNKYKEGDPLRRSENQDIVEDRRRRSNIFNRDGSVKKGLSYVRYSEALDMFKSGTLTADDVVSTNPKVVPFSKDSSPNNEDFVIVINRNNTEDDGKMAFDLLKWNEVNLSQSKDLSKTKTNFIEAYNKKKSSLEGYTYARKNQILKEWMDENIQFDLTDEYWASFEVNNIKYDELKKVSSELVKQEINRLEKLIKTIGLKKSNILKVYKLIGDYKEIDAEKISSDDKLLLESLDIDNSRARQELQQIFADHNMDMYRYEANPIVELNQSFYSLFEKITGLRYENATIQQKKTFFSGEYGMSADKYSAFLNFERSLSKPVSITSITGRMIERYKNIAEDPNNLDSIREAYLQANAPSWYKRYDANNEYGSFVRDLSNGKINVEELLDQYISGDSSNIIYKGEPLDMMQINPSFKFTLPTEQSTEELYEEYKSTTDLKSKFDLLMKMGGIDKLQNFPKEDLSWITNNGENLQAYIWMMDAHLNFLNNNDAVKSYNIFLRPQQRKGNLERYETFATKGNKLSQIKDGLKERFQYREDDFIDSYKDSRIPKYGLYRINSEELTDDILGSLVWANKQGNVYKNRVVNYGRMVKAMAGLERQNFEKGKPATETNYYKIAKEMRDYNFFGKTTTMKMETNILGQKVDLAKVLMWFRGFAIKQALGFSPIVALTNVISGVTQNQFLKWTGKNIYSDADDRALTILAPLTSDSIKDVGDFNPTSKLNKLMYSFGVYNIEDRFRNAKFNKVARVLPEAAFGMMAVGNFALQSRVLLSKLMEVRLVDGKFLAWRDYYLDQKMQDKNQTDKQIKAKFNEYSTKSMYDYLDDNGEFEMSRLEQDGYTGDIKNDKSRTMSKIEDIGEQVTMEIKNHNEGQAARDPLWSFALSLKKWLILANTSMFSRKRADVVAGGYEEGLVFSYKYIADVIQNARKENISLAQAFDGLEEYQKKNLKATGIITASMITLLALAFMLKKLADDEDEKDNYGLQLASYMMLRNLNETFSANIGIGNSMYESLQSPIMTASTLSNFTKVLNIGDIGEEVTKGKYKGVDKYLSNWIKLTSAKNIYTVKDADALLQTRQGYEFFTNQNALYHIFNMLPKKEDSGN